MYAHVSLYLAPGQGPEGHDYGVCFSNSANDTEDRVYLTGFPSLWHAWEFVLATTGIDTTQEAGVPARFRQWIYQMPKPESVPEEKQLEFVL